MCTISIERAVHPAKWTEGDGGQRQVEASKEWRPRPFRTHPQPAVKEKRVPARHSQGASTVAEGEAISCKHVLLTLLGRRGTRCGLGFCPRVNVGGEGAEAVGNKKRRSAKVPQSKRTSGGREPQRPSKEHLCQCIAERHRPTSPDLLRPQGRHEQNAWHHHERPAPR